MLMQGAKRRLQHDARRQSRIAIEGIRLPFLCPALCRHPELLQRASSTTKTCGKPILTHSRSQTASTATSQSRHLASAAIVENANHDYHLPFEPSPLGPYRSRPSTQSLSALRPFDPSSPPIVINDVLSTHPKTFKTKNAISGSLNEIHQNLHACLQVGRLERAAALMRRMNEIYKPGAPGLVAAHTEYVKEVAYRINQRQDQQLLQHLQKWFQVDLKAAGVEPDEEMYALMIRASLNRDDERRGRTVRRYVNLSKEDGLYDETIKLLDSHAQARVASFFNEISPEDTFIEHQDESYEVLRNIEDNSSLGLEVRSMQQKGPGLATLKRSLVPLTNPTVESALLSQTANHLNLETLGDELASLANASPSECLQARQRRLESHTLTAAIDRWRTEHEHLLSIGVNSSLSSSTIGAMMWKWHEELVPAIKEDIRKSRESEKRVQKNKLDADHLAWSPYLEYLSPEKISAITILQAMKLTTTDGVDESGVRTHRVVEAIGSGIQTESISERIKRSKEQSGRKGVEALVKRRAKRDSLSQLLRNSESDVFDKLDWGIATRVRLGAALLSHLIDIAKVQVSRRAPDSAREVQESHPCFMHSYQYDRGKRVGIVRLNSAVWEKLSRSPVGSALAKYLPMVAEPRPWTNFMEGGFLEHHLPVVRITTKDIQSRKYAITASANGDMDQVFAGLDVLSKTPWKINRFVFDVMLQAWNTGKAFAKIPPEEPPPGNPPEPPPASDMRERMRWMRSVRDFENHKSSLRSQRCFQNFQMEVARAYLNETFYFPHNCDFRGRAYPMVPFLNHMGADNARGLLKFAEGKELTASGLWWLKIHLANVFGYDKASLEERVKFADEHRADIYDSVKHPLDGNRWWLTAEDPWQCLATCRELQNAFDLPDPTKYVCSLAIHQDGSCNGLQHYAALGGDIAGARQVNLEPGARPSDIYTAVAELVKADIAKEAAQGKPLAAYLDGKVTRKVVKQTVMTNVYGVTFIGARRQVRKQLDDLIESFPETPQVNKLLASPYIARKIFIALATMFNGAHDIQFWLTDCAGRIAESMAPEQVDTIQRAAGEEKPPKEFKKLSLRSKAASELNSFKSTVIWTTPLKMPVVQPYRKHSIRQVQTSLQNLNIVARSAADPVDKAKQLQAFPPNFIHSLDATHMFLTALKCNEVGLTFAAIHDSFWTHAGDVDTMNRIIRDAFIRMHSEDIIGRLAAEFKARYKDHMHLASVHAETPVARQIVAWRRNDGWLTPAGFTAAGRKTTLEARKTQELLLERRRQQLLASRDPKERAEGKKMMTPARIYEEARSEKALAPPEIRTATIGGLGSTTSSGATRATKLKANVQLEVGDPNNAEKVQLVKSDEADAPLIAAQDDGLPETDAEADEAVAEINEDKDEAEAENGDLDADSNSPARRRQAANKKRRKAYVAKKVWVWLPLTFPPVPKKGEFDVTRLKDSQYFFS